ncbi:hypothetical protein ABZ865_22900 [Streptomyces sp. NPDC047085]|jgi:hypothetical protein|uniref:hypothetical protein n=1 Tax=Streptomyces sp. NPDC047085 TaxID=3155140 RepID=UPI003405C8F4
MGHHHHHKSNKQVAGDLDFGHGRGMPRRPNAAQLDRRIIEDRREAGLPVYEQPSPDAQYEEGRAEVERQVDRGEMETGSFSRRQRAPYPPSRYED